MAILGVTQITKAGVRIDAAALSAAAGGGDSFPNTGREFLVVHNGGGGSINVTFDSPGKCEFELDANAAHDEIQAVAAGQSEVFGPFPTKRFNDSNSRVQVAYSGVTTVTVGAFSLPHTQ